MPAYSVWSVPGIPEITAGDDLVAVLTEALPDAADGDILVISSKIVSKAEGRLIPARDREQAITDETVRVVATRRSATGLTRIVENRLGIVQAAAGVDASNVPPGHVLLLPVDPDASARRIAAAFRERGARVGVVITDTLGRPWRIGQTDVAIGAAGVRVIDDLRGTRDAAGRPLDVTVPAVADELAAAADLVKGKAASLPVAVVRGLGHLVTELDAPGARALVRPAEQDMFRLGSDEAYDEGYRDGYDAGYRESAEDDDAS
ncbi:coenzyme F420-0:L-glutamate ligase [Naasia sp. SYSU D00948]|uniref:coenzyme F420-0:L-glutamate ligase n=1 Tax=Naasia sp. SYSU D00948 TaxID=2817379 RepID=UPI001B30D1B0|nr:coenzyme F420-0:L-glutamate ligase [Naasia sp. SYSU D00948]